MEFSSDTDFHRDLKIGYIMDDLQSWIVQTRLTIFVSIRARVNQTHSIKLKYMLIRNIVKFIITIIFQLY